MADINKILFITLSNIGDVILTLPALDILRESFPQSRITVMVGPRPKEIFLGNPCIDGVIIYDKHSGLKENIRLFNKLKNENFDMVVDLRNSFFGLFLPARYKASFVWRGSGHMKERHLFRVTSYKFPPQDVAGPPRILAEQVTSSDIEKRGNSLCIKPQDREYIQNILKENGITEHDKIIVISPGARSQIKRWDRDKFAELVPLLIKEYGAKIILVGDKEDAAVSKYIAQQASSQVLDLTAGTSIQQLAYLLQKASLLIANDSAVLHLASYMNTPIVVIFGPTDETKYGPWSKTFAVAKKDISCRPCEKAQCPLGTLDCMHFIKVEDVLRQVKNILVQSSEFRVQSSEADFKRILIARTDRVGDVLLSTPVIKALRDNYPHAYIAMMVSPHAREIVEGNPYLDEVIAYDKDSLHRSWLNSARFALKLKRKKFDLSIILHPANRVHLVTFFAGVAKRIGYDLKLGFLLTDRIKHTKQLGEKHELEYNLDLLRHLGIEPLNKDLYMPKVPEAEKWTEELFKKEGIGVKDKLLAIHPGASCPSKVWPNSSFGEVADRLIDKYGFKVLILAGPKDVQKAEAVVKNMRNPAVNLAGKTSLLQLASVLRRCTLFISNDSGPVHVSTAVGIPVISLFGRAQKGLSPKRWGPVGTKDRFLHKDVGCIECLAHNCKKEFACLKAISVEDVLKVADSALQT